MADRDRIRQTGLAKLETLTELCYQQSLCKSDREKVAESVMDSIINLFPEPELTRISDEEIKIANQIPPEEYGAEPNWWLRVSRKVADAQLARDQKTIREAKWT